MGAKYTMATKAQDIYQNDAKTMWRRRLWVLLKQHGATSDHVAIMPGHGDAEIRVVTSMGVPIEKLHLIDDNPAIVAQHRRKRPQLGGTYGVRVVHAFERMSLESWQQLSGVHLDFCSCVSRILLEEMAHVARCGFISKGSVVAVTVLRGREPKAITSVMDRAVEWQIALANDYELDSFADVSRGWDGGPSGIAPTRYDPYRGALIQRALNSAGRGRWGTIGHGAYDSGAGSQTMYWCAFENRGEYWWREEWDASDKPELGWCGALERALGCYEGGGYSTPAEHLAARRRQLVFKREYIERAGVPENAKARGHYMMAISKLSESNTVAEVFAMSCEQLQRRVGPSVGRRMYEMMQRAAVARVSPIG